MIVTVQQMRKSVLGWLTEEGATVEQATELLSAIYAGAIAGDNYDGRRLSGVLAPWNEVQDFATETGIFVAHQDEEEVPAECGCLIDSLERIKHGRPTRAMGPATSRTFVLATLIYIGDTPSNSKWSRAAAKGVEDYIVWLEAA